MFVGCFIVGRANAYIWRVQDAVILHVVVIVDVRVIKSIVERVFESGEPTI